MRILILQNSVFVLVVDLAKYLPQKQWGTFCSQPPLLSAMVHAIYSRTGDMQLQAYYREVMAGMAKETCVGEVSRDMLEFEKSLQTASQEAEEATKLCHQREQKRNAAKAALEMTRIKLWQ
nr:hypothetical protein CFP56_51681 [Quercus suber]